MGRGIARRNYGKTRAAVAAIAQERIEILIGHAKDMVQKDEKLSRRYVSLARKISERTKVRIPREMKMYLCKECGIVLVPGRNSRIRLYARNSGLVITCLSCGAVKRYPVAPRPNTIEASPAMKPYMSQAPAYPKKIPIKD